MVRRSLCCFREKKMDRLDLNIADATKLGADLFIARRFGEAEGIFTALAKAQANDFNMAHMVGLCLIEQNKWSDALPWLDRAGALCRNEMITISCNRGMALGEAGRSAEALMMFNNLLRTVPS